MLPKTTAFFANTATGEDLQNYERYLQELNATIENDEMLVRLIRNPDLRAQVEQDLIATKQSRQFMINLINRIKSDSVQTAH